MRKSLLTTFIIISFCSAYGQQQMPEFGKIDIRDLQMKHCAFEPDADALKLFDVEETEFDMYTYNLKLKSERRIRIKIFNEKGYKHASIRIPYYSKKGVAKIKELSGAVYSLGPDGKVLIQRLEKKDFFKEKAVDNVGVVNFTFPNLKPGCVIEYKYTTVETNIYSIAPWNIQDKIPVLYTSKIVTTPVECRLIQRPYGIDSVKSTWYLTKNDRYRTLIYYHENIPAFKMEPYMSSINDHRIKTTFILYLRGASILSPTTKTNTDAMWTMAGASFIRSGFFKEFVKKNISGTEHLIDTARKIPFFKDRIGFLYNEVKKQIPQKSEQGIVGENPEDAWKAKSGTSFEINLILLNLLLKSDIPCMPVMVSTREYGKVKKDFPSIGQFNGFDIMAFDSARNYILDASIRYQSFLNPPLNILNREVFVMGQDTSQWVMVEDNRPLLKETMHIIADLNKDGDIEGTGNIQYYDYAKSYKLDTTLTDEDAEDNFYDKAPQGLKILSTNLAEPGADEDPLFETIEFRYETQKSDDFIFINPQLLTEKNKNPFIATSRRTEIDFGCNQLNVMTLQINLPPEFVVEHLPSNTTVKAPDSSFYYNVTYTLNGNKIFVSQSFESKRAIFTKEEYTGVQDFFKQMYGLMSKELILKKKQ